MSQGINEEWSYDIDISSLIAGNYITFLFFANDSLNNIGINNNNDQNYSIIISTSPISSMITIDFALTSQYLNTTNPSDSDIGLEINCTVSSSYSLIWVYLCENSTGAFANHSMAQGINGEWYFTVDISLLNGGDTLVFLFYANNSKNHIGMNDNDGINFSLKIEEETIPTIPPTDGGGGGGSSSKSESEAEIPGYNLGSLIIITFTLLTIFTLVYYKRIYKN